MEKELKPTVGLKKVLSFEIDGSVRQLTHDIFSHHPRWKELVDENEDYANLNIYGQPWGSNVLINIDTLIEKLNNLKYRGCSYVWVYENEDHETLNIVGYETLYTSMEGLNPLPETFEEDLHD